MYLKYQKSSNKKKKEAFKIVQNSVGICMRIFHSFTVPIHRLSDS